MKILLPLSILAYLCSLLPFLRTWNSSYRYANYCFNQDIFIEGNYSPCLVVANEASIEIFAFYMSILVLGIFVFGIVALYYLVKKEFAALFYTVFLAVADIAIIFIALMLILATYIGNICIYNQGGVVPCLTLTSGFITIYTIGFLMSLMLIGLIHKRVFSAIKWAD